MKLKRAEKTEDGTSITLDWEDGFQSRFHAQWLRYNSLDPETRSQHNGQRLISLLDIPQDIYLEEEEIQPDGSLRLVFSLEGHETLFPGKWLREHVYDQSEIRKKGWCDEAITLWDGHFEASSTLIPYSKISSEPQSQAAWLRMVRCYGFALTEGVPLHNGAVTELVKLFGFVRETEYGRWFEVRSEANPINLAYTNQGLQGHTDNPYRDPVPTLQLLACLENEAEGGESILIDGFKIVQILKEGDPEAFRLLSEYCARFEFTGKNGVFLKSKRPVIELKPDGELACVRFNNRSTAPLTDVPYEKVQEYLCAYRRLMEMVENSEFQVRFRLNPGALLILDNTRVLHARSSFSSNGSRWLQGCYADRDGLLSTLKALEQKNALDPSK